MCGLFDGILVVLLAQWSRLKETVASWVPAGTSWRMLLVMFLLGTLVGAGLTMMAHPHAWCEQTSRPSRCIVSPTSCSTPAAVQLLGRSAAMRKLAVLLQQARRAAKDKCCGDGRQ
jgi:hypothetical protein